MSKNVCVCGWGSASDTAGGTYDARSPQTHIVAWGYDKLPPLSRPSSHVQCPVPEKKTVFWIATVVDTIRLRVLRLTATVHSEWYCTKLGDILVKTAINIQINSFITAPRAAYAWAKCLTRTATRSCRTRKHAIMSVSPIYCENRDMWPITRPNLYAMQALVNYRAAVAAFPAVAAWLCIVRLFSWLKVNY